MALALLGLLWVLVLHDLDDHAQAESVDVQRHFEQLTSVGAQAVQSAARVADLQLAELRHEWQQSSPSFERVVLARQLRPPIGSSFEVTILDRHGRTVVSTFEANRTGSDMSDLASFRYFRDRAVDELWVTRHHGEPAVFERSHLDFSRPLLTREGEFDGVIICAIETDYLVSHLRELSVGRSGLMTLVSSDGAGVMQLARSPQSAARVAASGAAADVMRETLPAAALVKTEGFAVVAAPREPHGRLLAWRKAADYPMVLVIGDSAQRLDEALDDLRWRYLAAGAFGSIAILAGLYWSVRHGLIRDRISRQQAAHLRELTAAQAALTASQRELSELSSHQVVLEEAERKRIAREIHDELGQRLTVHRIDLAMLPGAVKADPAILLPGRVEALKADVDAMLAVARDIAHKLRPAALDIGLAAAVESLLREFSMKLGLSYELDDHLPSGFQADEERTVGAYRILQEAITNAARHATPQRVWVALWTDDRGLALRVHDDGCGFNPRALGVSGFGLSGMRERATSLGGRVEIVSRPGLGTSVEAHIPLPPDSGRGMASVDGQAGRDAGP